MVSRGGGGLAHLDRGSVKLTEALRPPDRGPYKGNYGRPLRIFVHAHVLIPSPPLPLLPPFPVPASADTTAERDYWQSFVWPALKELCDGLALTWEAVDLRCAAGGGCSRSP